MPCKKRNICIFTGSRAEWGLFYPLARKFSQRKDNFKLKIIATGAHVCSKFGNTYREIENDGFNVEKKIKILSSMDRGENILTAVNKGIRKFSLAFKEINPDLMIVLGDRFETFAAAVTCLFLKIPLAHIHGGEVTRGSLDDYLRHAITKMAHLHFTSTEVYRRRVIQLGENPKRVFNVGALGIDNILNMRLLAKEELEDKINFRFGKINIMVTFNPPTTEQTSKVKRYLNNLLKVLHSLKADDIKIIFTYPNPDIYSAVVLSKIREYINEHKDNCIGFTSMGRLFYLSSLQFVDIVAGNSSSGIIEVPSFGIPTINIGDRQRGRIKPSSVIDSDGTLNSVKEAFRKGLSPWFRRKAKQVVNPYGDGRAADRIVEVIDRSKKIEAQKQFFDLEFSLKKAG